MDAKPLQGKCVLITGGARRLGREIALHAARAGADVAITYRTSAREASQALRDIEACGVRGLAEKCDVRSEASVRKAVATVVKRLGGIDVLVNNAAIYETVEFEQITTEQWTEIFESNVRGPYLVMQAALASLRQRRGRIINMGSLGGLQSWPSHAHYSASKAALHHLSGIMAKALAPEIAVNCVAPGMIEMTDLADRDRKSRVATAKAATFFSRMAARTPVQRNGSAGDVAAAVMFFATAPHFITGQILLVDGGLDLA
jgi:NAD(P)-dependent dehydrogenase (short-subunit alcohol dehydrogenase family)